MIVVGAVHPEYEYYKNQSTTAKTYPVPSRDRRFQKNPGIDCSRVETSVFKNNHYDISVELIKPGFLCVEIQRPDYG